MQTTTTTNVTREFRDLDLNFNIHPVRKDINKHVGDKAIINSIRNLLSTNNYERLFNPIFGGNIRRLLFENLDMVTAIRVEKEIYTTIQNYEPRVSLQRVSVVPEYDSNAFNVRVEFNIVNRPEPVTITFQLERLR
jgi:phage baseplate assembly protein W